MIILKNLIIIINKILNKLFMIKLLKFYKNKIIIPEKGLTHNFLLDVIRTKKYYDNLIGDREDLVNKIKICADTFNFYKMNLDGYKGIYYTENVQ
jgi:hypothetical protein